MPTPFPGMDPYLERADLWPNVHTSLIIALRDELALLLRPRYYIAVEERVIRMGTDDIAFAVRPDVAVVRSTPEQSSLDTSITHATVGVVTVELPMPDEVREVYLDIREVGTDRVVTVIELLSPTNKNIGEG